MGSLNIIPGLVFIRQKKDLRAPGHNHGTELISEPDGSELLIFPPTELPLNLLLEFLRGSIVFASTSLSRGSLTELADNCSLTLAMSFGCKTSNKDCPKRSLCE